MATDINRNASAVAEIRKIRLHYRTRPYDFIKTIFKFDDGENFAGKFGGLMQWQEDTLKYIQEKTLEQDKLPQSERSAIKMAFATGHGVGKTALCGMISTWAIICLDDLEQVVVAGTHTQVKTKTWSEFYKWLELLPDSLKRFINQKTEVVDQLVHPKGKSMMTAFDSSNSDSFQGLHATNVIVMYDEASQIDSSIWEVTEGAMTTGRMKLWMAFGNPTRTEGRFYDTFHNDSFKKSWYTRNISQTEVSMSSNMFIKGMKDDYGEDSDIYKVRVLGQFPTTGDLNFFDNRSIQDAMNRPSKYFSPEQDKGGVLGIDVGSGGRSLTAFAYRTHQQAYKPEMCNEKDPQRVYEKAVEIITRLDVSHVFVDNNGYGMALYTLLKNWGGAKIYGVKNQESAMKSDKYINRRAEMFDRLKTWIAEDDHCFGVECGVYADQMRRILYNPNSKDGRMQLASKEETFKSFPSDESDALSLTFGVMNLTLKTSTHMDSQQDTDDFYRPPAFKGSWMSN